MNPEGGPIHRRQAKNFSIVSAALVAAAVAIALNATPAALAADELAIGAKGADFSLKGTDGKTYSLANVKGEKGTAVIFTCNECP